MGLHSEGPEGPRPTPMYMNMYKYMTIGKSLKSSLIGDVVGHSSLIRLEVMKEGTQILVTEQQKMSRVERVSGSLFK